MNIASVSKLPTAATSYYTVHKAGRYYDLVLVTPCGAKPYKTRLRRFYDRESAVSEGKTTAERAQRPFRAKGAGA